MRCEYEHQIARELDSMLDRASSWDDRLAVIALQIQLSRAMAEHRKADFCDALQGHCGPSNSAPIDLAVMKLCEPFDAIAASLSAVADALGRHD